MIRPYSVSQVDRYVKDMFEQDYLLKRIYIKGEVSNCKYHSSGHIYFSLKDDKSSISCVMFAGQRREGLSFHMTDGQQVIALGSLNVYEKDGRYQLYAVRILPDGDGVLYEKFLHLKQTLEEMGMFSTAYKKPIPAYARRIGVVTAPTGAVIHDIETVSARRNPFVQIILYPAAVQGEGAAESIASGIKAMSCQNVDVIIIGRGGGSMEDLWAFNEEIVARAIFECPIPVISAVGHETDTTIADYVADLRAPTPSAAAELAVFDYNAFQDDLAKYALSLRQSFNSAILANRDRAARLDKRFRQYSPENAIRDRRLKNADLEDVLRGAIRERLMEEREKTREMGRTIDFSFKEISRGKRHAYEILLERFKGLSPLEKLRSGYSFTETLDGKPIRLVSQARVGENVRIHVTDGSLIAKIKEARLYDEERGRNGSGK